MSRNIKNAVNHAAIDGVKVTRLGQVKAGDTLRIVGHCPLDGGKYTVKDVERLYFTLDYERVTLTSGACFSVVELENYLSWVKEAYIVGGAA